MSSNDIYSASQPQFVCIPVDQFHCGVCSKTFGSIRSLSKHVTQSHNYTPKEYHDQFRKGDQSQGICPECGKHTKFLGLTSDPANAYRPHCGNVCAQIAHKRELKADEERYQEFKSNCTKATKKVWDSYKPQDKKVRLDQLATVRERVLKMVAISTEVERKMMYSRYHKCDDETIERLNNQGREQLLRNFMNGLGGNYKHMKGIFNPRNPKKYAGDPNNIVYRSSWELRFMSHLDRNSNVIQWSSEELSIQYYDPTSNRYRRYFPDFIVKVKDKNSNIKIIMIEIKPENQTKQPEKRHKSRERTYLNELATWGKNTAKWNAAKEYCADKGWTFQILTEKDIFGSQ